MIRHCADCGAPFSLEPEEEDWFRRGGLTLPKRCARCRAARRGTKDQQLTCQRCGRSFAYPRELQLYARTYGWGTPRRCIGGCSDGAGGPETAEERAMRELLERLRDRRGQCDAPPIGAVLEAATPRPVPRPPSVQGLFRGLDEGPVEAGEGTDLRDALAHFQEQRPSPGDLFGDLDGGGEGGGSRSGKRRRRKKRRRPRPRD